MQNLKARIKRLEQKAGIDKPEVKEIICYIVNRHRPVNEAGEPLPEQEIKYISPEDFDLKKAVCIATSRKDDEPEYDEILRTAETGEPVLKQYRGIVKYFITLTLAEAREFMRACGIPESDIIAEWGAINEHKNEEVAAA